MKFVLFPELRNHGAISSRILSNMYVLWKFKKRKKIPNFPTLIDEVFFVIRSAAQMSPKIEFGFNNNNLIANFLQARG